MRVVLGGDDAVAAYVSAGLKVAPIHPPYTAFGIQNDDGELIGGILFNHYNGANIEATVYGRSIANRTVIRAMLHFVFVQCRCTRLTVKTRRSNRLVQELAPRLGFVSEYVQPRYFGPTDDDDAFVFVLWPETARRWLGDF